MHDPNACNVNVTVATTMPVLTANACRADHTEKEFERGTRLCLQG